MNIPGIWNLKTKLRSNSILSTQITPELTKHVDVPESEPEIDFKSKSCVELTNLISGVDGKFSLEDDSSSSFFER